MNYTNVSFEREDWIKNGCIKTYFDYCEACPYVVYDEDGHQRCDIEMYKDCTEN